MRLVLATRDGRIDAQVPDIVGPPGPGAAPGGHHQVDMLGQRCQVALVSWRRQPAVATLEEQDRLPDHQGRVDLADAADVLAARQCLHCSPPPGQHRRFDLAVSFGPAGKHPPRQLLPEPARACRSEVVIPAAGQVAGVAAEHLVGRCAIEPVARCAPFRRHLGPFTDPCVDRGQRAWAGGLLTPAHQGHPSSRPRSCAIAPASASRRQR